jgi:signal transduction histidine kinase
MIDDFPEVLRAGKLLDSLSAKTAFTIAAPIKVWIEASANFKTIGIAKISFHPMTLIETHLNRQEFQRNSLIVSLIPAVIIFFGILFFTTRPMSDAREEVENIIKGLQTRMTENSSFKELSLLAESINRALEKIGQSSGTSPDIALGNIGGPSQEFYRVGEWETIINCLNDGVMVVDPQNSIAMINSAAVRLLKIDHSGGVGKNVFETIEVTDIANSLRKLSEDIVDKNIDEPPPEEIEYGGPGMLLKIQALGLRESFGQVVATVYIFSQY